ncbi:general substrate transporter [Annulohypoxylon moriforme]|nr:general substrate transporter [Annulohypoxylon moriforme]
MNIPSHSQDGLFWWISNKGIVKLNLILLLSLISSCSCGYDTSMMNGLQSLDTWKEAFNHPGPTQLGLLNAVQNIGQLLSLPFCSQFCDTFGRRRALLISAVVILVGAALQGGAVNSSMFMVARGIIGFGLALNITAAPLLIIELAYPSQGAVLTGIYNSLFGLGALAAAWITYGSFRLNNDWAWRIPSLLQGSSSAIQVGLGFLVDESPRWLMSVDRVDEARALIVKYHANGHEDDPIVAHELHSINAALRADSETGSYLDFFRTPGNRRRFYTIVAVSFFSQWSGNGIISYYLTLLLDSVGFKTQDIQTLINALMTLWGMIVSIGFSLVVNRFRRRTLFLVSTAGCCVCYVIWTVLEAIYEKSVQTNGGSLDENVNEGDGRVAIGVIVMIFIFTFFYSVGWGTLQIAYPLEILPFHLRARGLVLYNLFCALALIFNQYVNPAGIASIGWKFYIVYDVWIFIELVTVYFLFVETTGEADLEEVAAIFDREKKDDSDTRLSFQLALELTIQLLVGLIVELDRVY